MRNFWKELEKPFFCLAPMSDVTDFAFRQILAKYSKNRENKNRVVFWTEFVAADGLADKLGRKKLAHILEFKENERPILAQVFGANPENMEIACRYIASLDFDGIDINMGCPDKSVISQGAGSALIRTPELARKIIQSARDGIKSAGKDIPVSVKTRIGFNQEEIDKWLPELLKENLSALTVHLRTKKEMSLVPAHWELMPKIIALRNKISPETLIIGNGDVQDLEDAKEKAEKYKCDGIMIGRGVFGNPFFFKNLTLRPLLTGEGWGEVKEKLEILVEHTELFEKTFMDTNPTSPRLRGAKNFAVMKKHFKAYVNGFEGAKELRIKLMETENARDVKKIINDFLKKL